MARHPERRVFLLDVTHVGQDLVAADIEGSEHHRLATRRVEHGTIERLLLAHPRHRRRYHELQLGAKEPDAGRTGLR